MDQKVKREQQYEIGKLTIDDQCTFKPQISPFAQRQAKRKKQQSVKMAATVSSILNSSKSATSSVSYDKSSQR